MGTDRISLRRWTRRAAVGAVVAIVPCARAQAVDGASRVPEPLSREQAVERALTRGAQAALAGATARIAQGQLLAARAFQNPIFNGTYSKSVPQYHATVELPLDVFFLRSLRVASAMSANEAARYQLAFSRASVRLDVDTLYTRASAAAARAALSHRNARDADSLLTVARVRRDAGDASDLDVELARVNAGQAENTAATDSLSAVATVLDLQSTIGMPSDGIAVALMDSLAGPGLDSLARLAAAPLPAGPPLTVSAAERQLASAEQSLALEHRNLWSGLALTGGVEWHDPTNSEPGLLPTIGLSIPLPLLNQRQGEIAVARATRDQARAQLELARRESELQIAQTRRELAVAVARALRDRALVASAERVAQMSLRAYAEGAYPLANVLEAQRNARDALGQLIDDSAAAANAAAALRLFTSTSLQ